MTPTTKTTAKSSFRLTVHFDIEVDGRCIAEVPELPGVMAYGKDITEAFQRVRKLALAVITERFQKN
jgi:predicted RNase H-like HicB family nuclease